MSDPRWYTSKDGSQQPLITRHHVIPLESDHRAIHCAQETCWCNPILEFRKGLRIYSHNPVTTGVAGWTLVGERHGEGMADLT